MKAYKEAQTEAQDHLSSNAWTVSTRPKGKELLQESDALHIRCGNAVRRLNEQLVKEKEQKWSFQVAEVFDRDATAYSDRVVILRSGLVRNVTNDILAYILAHEMSHILLNHHDKITPLGYARLMRYIQFVFLYSISFPWLEMTKRWAKIESYAEWLSDKIENPSIKRFYKLRRDHEFEADELAIKMIISAGYDPEGSIQFFQRQKRKSPEDLSKDYKFRSHPLPDERIRKIREYIREVADRATWAKITGGNKSRDEIFGKARFKI